MGFWAFFLHLLNFVLPALALSAVLTLGVVGWRGLAVTGPRARRLWRVWGGLALVGVLVLAAGLAYFGVDGKMATYGALVLAMGSTAWWLARA